MKALYKPLFRKCVKKQARPFQLSIEDEVEKIILSPEKGEHKTGDLKGFHVHKFYFRKKNCLIAYQFRETEIVFYMVGTHENFYRDLKKYLRETGQ